MREPIKDVFRRRLIEELKERGWSDTYLAERAGIGQRSVSRYQLPDDDDDYQIPTLEKLDAIAKAFGYGEGVGWVMLVDRDATEQRIIKPPVIPQSNAGEFPAFPKIFKRRDRKRTSTTPRKRRRSV